MEVARPPAERGALRLVNGADDPRAIAERLPDREADALADGALVARALEGDARAFEALVRRHLRAAYAVARPLVLTDEDAEDACQDAFIRALEKLEDCRNPNRFRAWFLTIVRNRAHNLRKYERRREAEILQTQMVASGETPARALERKELGGRLQAALSQLTDRQRNVVLLHDYEGWQHAEIGKKLGMSAGASRFSLHAARKKLRALLKDDAPKGSTP